MVSSKFSHRFKVYGRPKICKPPPPPPPLLPWPPTTFELHYLADFSPPAGPIHVNRTFQMSAETPPGPWVGEIIDGPDHYYATWAVDTEAETADLSINGAQQGEGFHSNRYDHPIVPGSPHIYIIDEWDDYDPGDLTAKATFTF